MPTSRDKILTHAALFVSTVTLIIGLIQIFEAFGHIHITGAGRYFEFILFVLALAALFYGSAVYQITRLGWLRRYVCCTQIDREAIETIYDRTDPPRVVVLIPSYKEEFHVVLQTVLSAALSEYAHRRVVLLVDDPPRCSGGELAALNRTRQMIRSLNQRFQEMAARFSAEHKSYVRRVQDGASDPSNEAQRLAVFYEQAAAFVEELGAEYETHSSPAFAHADRLFMDTIIRASACAHRNRANELLRERGLGEKRILHEFRRLAALFACGMTSFERKLYENLSHTPNKAMNLNSYMGLLGGSFREVANDSGLLRLVECQADEADLVVPDAEYALTLDADTVVLPDYLLKVTKVMEADERLAVVQSPYTAFPDAPTTLQRIAGATTDIQYIAHQGLTAYGATFWIGANALLRVTSIRDICVFTKERGHRLPVYIQDKTLIEDTGSTIDLVCRGWRLFNYPERLAYSATPPDYGSLLIQRRRWANGGLIIFPGLLRHVFSGNGGRPRLAEIWLRLHYLVGLTIANCSFLILLVFPFDSALFSGWLLASALPYYVLYARDLKLSGYRHHDILRVHALTLLLIPVNLAGVARSIQQMITGRKSAFGRTPKVEGRIGTPPIHILVLVSVIAALLASVILNLILRRYSYAVLWAINAASMLYGFTAMIGWKEAAEDVLHAWRTSKGDAGEISKSSLNRLGRDGYAAALRTGVSS